VECLTKFTVSSNIPGKVLSSFLGAARGASMASAGEGSGFDGAARKVQSFISRA
jgi:hypothetical protein